MATEPDPRSVLRRQALSLALAVAPFGVAFGVATGQAGMTVWQAAGFSMFVFTGAAQFAAVEVLNNGGSALSAVTAGLLLSLRTVAFGVIMAPALRGSFLQRALMSQVMVDEVVAVGTAHTDLELRRYGYIVTGMVLFVSWNVATLVGRVAVSSEGTLVTDLGLDATIPAAFLALLWPRLAHPDQRRTALCGAAIAIALVPLTPPGVPIVAAALGVLVARPRS